MISISTTIFVSIFSILTANIVYISNAITKIYKEIYKLKSDIKDIENRLDAYARTH